MEANEKRVIKKKKELIKVKKCSYFNNMKSTEDFNMCKCIGEEYYPICSSCKNSCHSENTKDFHKVDPIYDDYLYNTDLNKKPKKFNISLVCFCAINNHGEKRKKVKIKLYKKYCHFEKYAMHSEIKHYKVKQDEGKTTTNNKNDNKPTSNNPDPTAKNQNNKIYCEFCFTICENIKIIDKSNHVIEDAVCECDKDHSINKFNHLMYIKIYLEKSNNLNDFYLIFNFNMLLLKELRICSFFEKSLEKYLNITREKRNKEAKFSLKKITKIKDFKGEKINQVIANHELLVEDDSFNEEQEEIKIKQDNLNSNLLKDVEENIVTIDVEEEKNSLFLNYFIFKIVKIYDLLRNNKNYYQNYLVNMFKMVKNEDFKSLFKINENLAKMFPIERNILFENHIFFANLIFDSLIKKKVKSNINTFKLNTFMNLDIIQRMIFIQENLKLHLYFKEENKLNENFSERVKEYLENFIGLYLKSIEIVSQIKNAKNTFFKIFCEIFKFSIKYNLISDIEIRTKFFEIAYDHLKTHDDNVYPEWLTELMKCVFYELIAVNDYVFTDFIKNNSALDDKKANFCFISNIYNNLLSKIFLYLIKIYKKTIYIESKSTTNSYSTSKPKIFSNFQDQRVKFEKFNLIIVKIFDLLVGNGDFYIKSISRILVPLINPQSKEENKNFEIPLDHNSNNNDPSIILLSKNFLRQKEIIQQKYELNSPISEIILGGGVNYFDKIKALTREKNKFFNNFNEKIIKTLKKANKGFHQHEITVQNYENYLKYLNSECFDHFYTLGEIDFSTLQLSKFFNLIDDFFQIFSKIRSFVRIKSNDKEKFKSIGNLFKSIPNLDSLFKFISNILENNLENIRLFMDVDPRGFIYTFSHPHFKLDSLILNLARKIKENLNRFSNFAFICDVINIIICEYDQLLLIDGNDYERLNLITLCVETINIINNLSTRELLNSYSIVYKTINTFFPGGDFNKKIYNSLENQKDNKIDNKNNDKLKEEEKASENSVNFFTIYETQKNNIRQGGLSENRKVAIANGFLVAYLTFINNGINHNLHFNKIIDLDKLLIKQNVIKDKIADKVKFVLLDFNLQIEMIKLNFAVNLKYQFNIMDIKETLDSMLVLNVDLRVYLIELIQKTQVNSENKDKKSPAIDKIPDIYSYLKKEFEFYDEYKEFLKDKESQGIELKISEEHNLEYFKDIINYYENALFRPMYYLMSLHNSTRKKSVGQRNYQIFELFSLFIITSLKVYKDLSMLLNEISRKLEKDELDKKFIKVVLDEISLKELNQMKERIENKKIDYLDMDTILEDYWYATKIIINDSRKVDEIEFKIPKEEPTDEKNSIISFLYFYQKKLDKTVSNNLSIIKVLENLDTDEKFSNKITFYLINNFFSSASGSELDKPYEKIYNFQDAMSIVTNMKIQNQEYLKIFMNLIDQQNLKFQKLVKEKYLTKFSANNEKQKDFLPIIVKYLLFPNIIISLHDLFEFEKPYAYKTLALVKSYLKFLRFLCHNNKEMQNIFFNLDFKSTITRDKIRENEETHAELEEIGSDDEGSDDEWKIRDRDNKTVDLGLKSVRNLTKDKSSLNVNSQSENNKDENIGELEEYKTIAESPFNFVNFLSSILRLIIHHCEIRESNVDLTKFKDIDKLNNTAGMILKRIMNFFEFMIENSDQVNFEFFYSKANQFIQSSDEGYQINKKKRNLRKIQFQHFLLDYFLGVLPKEDFLDPFKVTLTKSVFKFLNSLLVVHRDFNLDFLNFLTDNCNIKLVSKYITNYVIILNMYYDITNKSLTDYNYLYNFKNFRLKKGENFIYNCFTKEKESYKNEIFLVGNSMYLFIFLLSYFFKVEKAENIINMKINLDEYHDKGELFKKEDVIGKNIHNSEFENRIKYIKMSLIKVNPLQTYDAITFFKTITGSVEFIISKNTDVQNIFFTPLPSTFYLKEEDISEFVENSTSKDINAKLIDLVNQIEIFTITISFKEEFEKKSSRITKFIFSNFANDLISFLIGVVINLILVSTLQIEENYLINYKNTYNAVLALGLIQIVFNLSFNYLYLNNFYEYDRKIYKIKSRRENPNFVYENKWFRNMLNKLNTNFISTIILNDNLKTSNVNILIAAIGISQDYLTFLFPLQLLLGISRFFETIREITTAFKNQMFELISMVGFLAVLVYFFSTIGFYFLQKNLTTITQNCNQLYGCFIYHFSEGVRTGGGIGDRLNPVPYNDDNYALIFFYNMFFYITVILLNLNMINGIIINTFAQMREDKESKRKEKDNKCYVCGIDKKLFERNNKNFKDHINIEHSLLNYFRYLIKIKETTETNLDSNEFMIINRIKNYDINCFPIKQTFRKLEVQDDLDDGDDEENNEEASKAEEIRINEELAKKKAEEKKKEEEEQKIAEEEKAKKEEEEKKKAEEDEKIKKEEEEKKKIEEEEAAKKAEELRLKEEEDKKILEEEEKKKLEDEEKLKKEEDEKKKIGEKDDKLKKGDVNEKKINIEDIKPIPNPTKLENDQIKAEEKISGNSDSNAQSNSEDIKLKGQDDPKIEKK